METAVEVVSLTKEDLANWHSDRTTRVILAKIAELVKEAHLNLGGGVVLDADRPENTAQNYAKMVGYIAGLRAVLNIEALEDGDMDA